jgi:hypothetical protein
MRHFGFLVDWQANVTHYHLKYIHKSSIQEVSPLIIIAKFPDVILLIVQNLTSIFLSFAMKF